MSQQDIQTRSAALHCKGRKFRDSGCIDDAIACYQEAIALAPDNIAAYRDFLLAILYSSRWNNTERFEEHLKFARLHTPVMHRNLNDGSPALPDRRLRIGYLSCNFADHPVGRNLAPVLLHRNRQAFEAVCFAEVDEPDAFGRNLLDSADRWIRTTDRNDTEVAALIAAERIDILVVLAGHLDRNRLTVAAHRPAPIQISYHDAATSGLAAMDYLLTDRFLCPPNGTEQFTERLLRLPSLMYMAPLPAKLMPERPADAPLVFANLNAPAKLTEPVIAAWAEILRTLPQARLLFRHRDAYAMPDCRENLSAAFARHGVYPTQLDFRGGTGGDPLDIYHDVDVVLDSFPFSGSTTTFESLWMGVPVVTLPTDSMVGRWSAAILSAAGRQGWIARDRSDYVQLSLALARDRQAIRKDLRRGQFRDHLQAVLCNGPRKAAQLERLYRAVWARWRSVDKSKPSL
ncbi:tetratricopeptide repeat protein [Ferrovibrio terrae]|uniref:O-linked N-acetylglucosamine transferase, SPINDLY family protein n=1 Tax=Ferrovibrio terrae TaxID=2594003 RepID=UPI003138242B